MDYKLEALHKERENRAFMVGLIFVIFILPFLVFMVLFAFLGNIVFAIIGLSSLTVIIGLIIALGSGLILPDWLNKAEQEYQAELAKIKREREAEIEVQFRKIMDKNKERNEKIDYLISQKQFIARLVENVGVLEYLARNYPAFTDCVDKFNKHQDEIKASLDKLTRMDTLDKKLEPKKPYKITLNEFFRLNNRACIRIHSKEQSIELSKAFKEYGKTRFGGDSYYEYYKDETCYSNDCGFSPYKWYEQNHYTIYDFSEVDFESKKKGGK